MRKQMFQDERILAQRRKIGNEAITILMIVLGGSVLVQHYFFNAPFEQFAVEFIGLVGIGAYMVIRHLTLGIDVYGESRWAKHLPLISGLICGAITTTINGVLNHIEHAELYTKTSYGYFIAMLAVTFISSFALTFLILRSIGVISKRKQAQIEKRLKEEEND